MAIASAIVILITLPLLVYSLVMMLFSARRPRFRRVAKWSGAALVLSFCGLANFASEEQDAQAVAAGWTSSSDQRDAEAAGVSEPEVWKSRQAELAKKKADDEVRAAEVREAALAEENARKSAFLKLTEPPSDQAEFLDIVLEAREAYRVATTEFNKGATRPSRSSSLCAALESLRVEKWVGKVATIDTNSEGLGILAVSLADDVRVGTWNNAISDLVAETLIPTTSPVDVTPVFHPAGARVLS